jgi:hypothetical protein
LCEHQKKFFGLSENHIIVGELLEQKASFDVDNVNTPHIANGDASWNPDSESSQATGGFSVAFSLSVVQVAFNTIWLTYFDLICSYTCFFFLFWSDFYTSSVVVPSLTFCNIMHLIHIAEFGIIIFLLQSYM